MGRWAMSNDDKKIKELEESIRRMEEENRRTFGGETSSRKTSSDLLQFFIGLLLVGVGLFWVFQSVQVETGWLMGLGGLGGLSKIPTGVVTIPLLIGIVMLFFMEKRRIFAWIVTVLGVLIILLAIILSVHITMKRMPFFNYVLMFGFIAAGSGLLLKTLFRKRN